MAVVNAVDENDRVVLHGNIHPKARPEFDMGPTDPSLPAKRMILLLKLAPDNQAALDQLVADQHHPSSPNFHHWLTPEEFGERFGRTPKEIEAVKGWLIAHGLSVDETAKGGNWINFSGTAARVENAFRVKMHDYLVDGKLHHANSTDPSIPRALAGVVAGPVTLHNFRHKPAYSRARSTHEGQRKPGYSYQGYTYQALSPGDFALIYDVNAVYNLGYGGKDVTIAVAEQTHPKASPSSWNTFRSTFGLPYNPPKVIVNGPDPGDTGVSDDGEADLDVEWSGAVAPGATIDFVVSGSGLTNNGLSGGGVDLSAQYIVDNRLAPIVSYCYVTCESDMGSAWLAFYYALWEQAASQGMTVFVAAGDTGAYGCTDAKTGYPTGGQAVNGMASTPYNIAVGGTRFYYDTLNPAQYWNINNTTYDVSALGYIAQDVSALSYIPEFAWNDLWFTPDSGETVQHNELASGGGPSSIYTKPAWQVSPGVPTINHRYLPDVSLNADDVNAPYMVYSCTNSSGSCTMPGSNDPGSWPWFGGTSGATPSFAGIMALIVQKTGGVWQGNFNVVLYQLGQAQYGGKSGALQVFHDITFGTNGFTDFGADLPGYSCTTGYDPVTGLGSVDAFNLFMAVDPPAVATFTINNNASSTSSRAVTLNNTTTGGTPTYYMASEFSNFYGAAWQPYSTAPYFTLSAGNGTKTIYFMVMNATGTSSPKSNSIELEQTPTVTSFRIDGGAESTINPTVTLNNTATVSPTKFMASEDAGFTGATWQPYSIAPKFSLITASGLHTVYFKVENSAGPSTPVSQSIQLVLRPEVASFQINGSATPPPTSSLTIALNNTATNSPTYYMASQSPSFSGATWKSYSTDPSFTLSAGNGSKTVYFKVMNAAGASPVAKAVITLQQ